jgi:hypothetical protein
MTKIFQSFDSFIPTVDTFSKKIGLVGEDHGMPDLFGDEKSDVLMSIPINDFSTHQVFNRLAGSSFIPEFVSSRMHTQKIKTPITVISPISEIRTYNTHREINTVPLRKDSLYFKRPKINEQIQIASYEGTIVGARQIVDGHPVHLNINRYPKMKQLQYITEALHNNLKSDFMRFRVGLTNNGPVLLAMENFKLRKPELARLYVNIYENFIGPMPDWFKGHIDSTMINPYLNEYVNREEISKKCPYML